MQDIAQYLDGVAAIAADAGRAAMEFYGLDVPIERKADNSPLTQADKASHAVTTSRLRELTPQIAVVSEESAELETARREAGDWLWLVDPLDGTKEFIKQTGSFTVNIGLVHLGYPVLGVVHAPVSGLTYLGINQGGHVGAWVRRANTAREAIRTRKARMETLTVVASRDHAGPVVKAFLDQLTNAHVTSMGSSLKFCLIAEGKADFYPRIVPTMQWDTAAAQAIVEAAGGHLTDLHGHRLNYPPDRLRNPSTLAFGDDGVDWPRLFGEGTEPATGR
ncbi:MAG: 3'(2'),5'-bisphosphate nucleotidase CysQ [Planctomycetes bacterium]|nr:3'(2'),5'-bisphosphate nucleotidase CysQ [Planctomycetota bacterium]